MSIIAGTHDSTAIKLVCDALQLYADVDGWAVARLAELRAAGEVATASVVFAPHPKGTIIDVRVRREDGTIESSATRGKLARLNAEKYTPCELHRRIQAELERQIQSTTTAEELTTFGGDQREFLQAVKACPNCKKEK